LSSRTEDQEEGAVTAGLDAMGGVGPHNQDAPIVARDPALGVTVNEGDVAAERDDGRRRRSAMLMDGLTRPEDREDDGQRSTLD
jgi:hypothetical protein